MRKGVGIFGQIRKVITFVLLMIVLLAVLPYFNWDPIAMILWVANKIWVFIVESADKLNRVPELRELFSR